MSSLLNFDLGCEAALSALILVDLQASWLANYNSGELQFAKLAFVNRI